MLTASDANLSPSLVEEARHSCNTTFERLMNGVSEIGIDPTEQAYRFAEIAARHRLRWDIRPSGPSPWTHVVDEGVSAVLPIIERLHALPPHPDDGWFAGLTSAMRHFLPVHPVIDQRGAIMSLPGAKAQRFHADAPDTHFRLAKLNPRHRLFNVFIPLVDIKRDDDGTQFWPRSHLESTRYGQYMDAVQRSGHLEDDNRAMAAMWWRQSAPLVGSYSSIIGCSIVA